MFVVVEMWTHCHYIKIGLLVTFPVRQEGNLLDGCPKVKVPKSSPRHPPSYLTWNFRTPDTAPGLHEPLPHRWQWGTNGENYTSTSNCQGQGTLTVITRYFCESTVNFCKCRDKQYLSHASMAEVVFEIGVGTLLSIHSPLERSVKLGLSFRRSMNSVSTWRKLGQPSGSCKRWK